MALAHRSAASGTETQFHLIRSDIENQLASTNCDAGHRGQRNTPSHAVAEDEFAPFQEHLAVTFLCAPLTMACGFASHV